MKWFGKRWGGDVCKELPKTENPGGNCLFCGELLQASDSGFLFPETGRPCHCKCLHRAIFGKAWVDHEWEVKHVTLWDRMWTCRRCRVSVGKDPSDPETFRRDYPSVSKDCNESLVIGVSKS